MLEGLTCPQRQHTGFPSLSEHLLSTHMGNIKACLLFGLPNWLMIDSHSQLYRCSLQVDLVFQNRPMPQPLHQSMYMTLYYFIQKCLKIITNIGSHNVSTWINLPNITKEGQPKIMMKSNAFQTAAPAVHIPCYRCKMMDPIGSQRYNLQK
jgi:hypothetical protein